MALENRAPILEFAPSEKKIKKIRKKLNSFVACGSVTFHNRGPRLQHSTRAKAHFFLVVSHVNNENYWNRERPSKDSVARGLTI